MHLTDVILRLLKGGIVRFIDRCVPFQLRSLSRAFRSARYGEKRLTSPFQIHGIVWVGQEHLESVSTEAYRQKQCKNTLDLPLDRWCLDEDLRAQ